jgi:enediyne biosynthesis protein E3
MAGSTLRQRLLSISPEETSFSRRGFRCRDTAIQARLEQVGGAFVGGYHAALAEDRASPLGARLEGTAPELRGFAFEGASFALTLLDVLTPWNRGRLRRFIDGPAMPHVYLASVGAGWALARSPVRLRSLLVRLDPLLGWLALDGYGFHQGFFHWPEAVERQAVPRRLSGYARRGFDQGLGRSLWFVDGADVERLPRTIAAFPAERQGDLWSGVGLACAYAGGRDRAAIAELAQQAGPHAAALAQGAAFAAKARQSAGNLTADTALACDVICGMTAERAAAVTDEARQGLPGDGTVPAYEVWRQRIQDRFTPTRFTPDEPARS